MYINRKLSSIPIPIISSHQFVNQNMALYTYKYRLKPTEEQKQLLSKHFGCTRFIWNYFLAQRKDHYEQNKEAIKNKTIKSPNRYDNQFDLVALKKQENYKWLQEVNSQSLQCILRDLDLAYKNFFKQTHRYPKFKNKNDKQSFEVPQHIKQNANKIIIPKFLKGINFIQHRPCIGQIRHITIHKTPTDKYFASIVVEKERVIVKTDKRGHIGLDMGLIDTIAASTGKKIQNPKTLSLYQNKLKYQQRQLSKKQKGGKNRNKARLSVAKTHEKITNSRKDFLHKLSTQIVNENQVIAIENLKIKSMMKNHHLAKSIGDASWYELRRQLEYKSKFHNRQLIAVDPKGTSKECSKCKYINRGLNLSIRSWRCPKCASEHDRDINAAKNILNRGLLAVGTAVKKRAELSLVGG